MITECYEHNTYIEYQLVLIITTVGDAVGGPWRLLPEVRGPEGGYGATLQTLARTVFNMYHGL